MAIIWWCCIRSPSANQGRPPTRGPLQLPQQPRRRDYRQPQPRPRNTTERNVTYRPRQWDINIINKINIFFLLCLFLFMNY